MHSDVDNDDKKSDNTYQTSTPIRHRIVNRKRKSPDEANSSSSSSSGVEYAEGTSSSDESFLTNSNSEPRLKNLSTPNRVASGRSNQVETTAGISNLAHSSEKRKRDSPEDLRGTKKHQVNAVCDDALKALGEHYRNEILCFMRSMVISDHESHTSNEEEEEDIEISDGEAIDKGLLSNSMLAVL